MTRKQRDEGKQAEQQRKQEREERRALRQALFQQRLAGYRAEIAGKSADQLEATGPPVDPALWDEWKVATRDKRVQMGPKKELTAG